MRTGSCSSKKTTPGQLWKALERDGAPNGFARMKENGIGRLSTNLVLSKTARLTAEALQAEKAQLLTEGADLKVTNPSSQKPQRHQQRQVTVLNSLA